MHHMCMGILHTYILYIYVHNYILSTLEMANHEFVHIHVGCMQPWGNISITSNLTIIVYRD